MRISSHHQLIQAVTEAVFAVCAKSGDAFSLGVCFGYASTFVEAIQAGTVDSFFARMRGELDETLEARHRFFFGMGIHQALEKFPEKFPPKTNLVLQNICTSSAIVAPDCIRNRGGLAYLMQHAGCYDINGLKDSLFILHHLLNQYQEEATFLLIGADNAIALHMQQSRATLASSSNPSQASDLNIQNDNDVLVLATQTMRLLEGFTKANLSPKLDNHLVITWQWVCCRDDLARKTSVREALKNHPLFQQHDTLALANLPDKKGKSWLMAALKSKEIFLISAMLTRYPSLKQEKEIGLGLVALAVYYNLPEVLYFLLNEGFNPNTLDDRGLRPLHYAVMNCDKAMMKILLAWGADKNLESSQKLTPLIYSRLLLSKAKEPIVRQDYEEMIQAMSTPSFSIS